MKLYIVRHGETDWNLAHKAQGRADIPLNQTGIRQAEELKTKIKNINFDRCYCSPLIRAKQTAAIITDGRVEIVYDENLKERDYGDLEGTDAHTWDIDDFNLALNTNEHNIEPIKSVFARSKKVLDRIKSENNKDAVVLVVAHGTLLKTLHFNLVGYDEATDLRAFRLENCALAEYDVDVL